MSENILIPFNGHAANVSDMEATFQAAHGRVINMNALCYSRVFYPFIFRLFSFLYSE